MLTEAIEFPFGGHDWLRTVLIGGVLSMLSFLIVPGLIVNGYLLRVARAGVHGEGAPPRFEDWIELLIEGVVVWIVQLIYVVVPSFLLVVLIGSFVVLTGVTSSTGPDPAASSPGALVGGLIGGLLVVIGLLLVLGAIYLLPAALANYARTGDVTDAFALRTVGAGAFNRDYLLAMLLVIGLWVVLGFIGSVLTLVIVGVFVLFYLQMIVYHLFGQGFARGLGLDRTADTVNEPAR